MTNPLYTTQVGGSTFSATTRESFEDRVTIFSPQDTPLQMMLPRRQVSAVRSSWMVDDIATPTSVATVNEGVEFSSIALNLSRRTRLYNEVATQARAVTLSDESRLVNEAGIYEEFGYQIAREGLELSKQTEVNLWHSEHVARESAAGAIGSGTAGQTAGLLEWALQCGLSRSLGATADQPIGSSLSTVPSAYWGHWYHLGESGTFGSKTIPENSSTITRKQLIEDVLAPYYRIGGDISASVVFAPSLVKAHLSNVGLTYAAASSTDIPLTQSSVAAERKEAVWAVDHFDTDFGVISVALCRYLEDGNPSVNVTVENGGTDQVVGALNPKGHMVGVDPRYCRIMQLRPMDFVPIAKSGDNTKGMLRSTCGFQPDSPMALWGASNVVDMS